MRVVFRADASVTVGTGHVRRCLTLAEVLRADGHDAAFICRESDGDLIKFIESEKGFPVHRLPIDGSPEEDAQRSIVYVQDAPTDWLVVDHYALDKTWETQLRPHTKRLMVIDDLANRPHDCDLLLDQNLADDDSRYDALVPSHCTKLLGPNYALLRPEFAEARAGLSERDEQVKHLLVSFGGSDETNETAKVLNALALLDRSLTADLGIDVVIGQAHPHKTEFEARCAEAPNLTLHVQTSDVAKLMTRADLALGAGGSTTWERLCLGLPSLIVSTADNQVAVAETVGRRGAALYLGTAAAVSAAQWASALAFTLDFPSVLRALSQTGLALVDGRGTARVARALQNLSAVSVRVAQMNDAERIFEWRNHETVRRASFSSEPILLEQHTAWLERTLADPERLILVGEQHGNAVGVVRYDIDPKTRAAEVSIFLAPECQGSGLGPALLAAGEAWLRGRHADISYLTAHVKTDNRPSQTLFQQSGYKARATTFQKQLAG